MTLQNRLFLLFVLLGACVGCDQATKRLATFALKNAEARTFFGNLFRLEYAENTGAFLSLGADLPDPHRFIVMTLISGTVLILLGVFVCVRRNMALLDFVGYVLILAGGLSNLLDRAVAGFVVDFMNIGFGTLRTGIFNVADLAIMAGLALVTWGQMQGDAKASDTPLDRAATNR